MIVLDTNVISELMRSEPSTKVLAWAAVQLRGELYTTCINQIEINYGLAILPDGRRREVLKTAAEAMFSEDFAGRILPFDSAAAARYPEVMLSRRRLGQPIEGFDALIAAICLGASASIATRDVGGFSNCGVPIINPWTFG